MVVESASAMPLLLCVLVSLMLFGTGCNQDKIARLERENKELAEKLDSLAKAANLDMQAKCANQATNMFKESGLGKERISSYTNHYQPKLNKCFVKFSTLKHEGKGTSIYMSIQDAFEGKGYAEYYWINNQGQQAWQVKPFLCKVTLLSSKETNCQSQEEFDELAKVYMEQ